MAKNSIARVMKAPSLDFEANGDSEEASASNTIIPQKRKMHVFPDEETLIVLVRESVSA